MDFAIKMENCAWFCLVLFFHIHFCLLRLIVFGVQGGLPPWRAVGPEGTDV